MHRRLLKEYMQPSFSVQEFKKIAATKPLPYLIGYCIEHLGESVGSGSSRSVFDFTDDMVLKVAHSAKGIRQNEQEYAVYNELNKNPLLPAIYDVDPEFKWMLVEAVLPAKEGDFKKILGIPYGLDGLYHPKDEFNYDEYDDLEKSVEPSKNKEEKAITFINFIIWFADYSHDCEDWWTDYEKETYRELMSRDWFQNLIELFEIQEINEFLLPNMGIAMRNNKPTIVCLDVGYKKEN